MSDESPLVVCLSTVASEEDAARLANVLLNDSLAACVQIDGPIRSHYRWKGELHCDTEFRLMIKSSLAVSDALKAKLMEIHPYEEPQIVMLPISDASVGYRTWVLEQTGGSPRSN